ncbi:co-chaperone protein p23-1 [Raphanus sativus]|uniref:Co-chaperone protein p23 n=1 Tax=Raphanus sativus TaxID=3726 RepID=A0A6J0JEW6_RAPSA|nr:co-chaperone protein p23-1 [Raphanus sativus]
MSHHPGVKWEETTDKIFLTVVLADSKETKVNLLPEVVFDFSAKAGPENHVYELKLELHNKVNVEESKINIGLRSIFCIIEKIEPETWDKIIIRKGHTMSRLIGRLYCLQLRDRTRNVCIRNGCCF